MEDVPIMVKVFLPLARVRPPRLDPMTSGEWCPLTAAAPRPNDLCGVPHARSSHLHPLAHL
eukprot:3481306-Prymnesium_polylepis.1